MAVATRRVLRRRRQAGGGAAAASTGRGQAGARGSFGGARATAPGRGQTGPDRRRILRAGGEGGGAARPGRRAFPADRRWRFKARCHAAIRLGSATRRGRRHVQPLIHQVATGGGGQQRHVMVGLRLRPPGGPGYAARAAASSRAQPSSLPGGGGARPRRHMARPDAPPRSRRRWSSVSFISSRTRAARCPRRSTARADWCSARGGGGSLPRAGGTEAGRQSSTGLRRRRASAAVAPAPARSRRAGRRRMAGRCVRLGRAVNTAA